MSYLGKLLGGKKKKSKEEIEKEEENFRKRVNFVKRPDKNQEFVVGNEG